jgi:ATP-binding cassette subfamily F protein 3
LSKVETEIAKLENEIKQDDIKISEDFEKLRTDQDFFKNYQSKKDKLDLLMEEWEDITEKLEGA